MLRVAWMLLPTLGMVLGISNKLGFHASRHTFGVLMLNEDIPVYGTYDDEFRNSLKPYIDNLCMASGLVECKEAFHLAVEPW